MTPPPEGTEECLTSPVILCISVTIYSTPEHLSLLLSMLLFLVHQVFPTGLVNVTIFSTSKLFVGTRQFVALDSY